MVERSQEDKLHLDAQRHELRKHLKAIRTAIDAYMRLKLREREEALTLEIDSLYALEDQCKYITRRINGYRSTLIHVRSVHRDSQRALQKLNAERMRTNRIAREIARRKAGKGARKRKGE